MLRAPTCATHWESALNESLGQDLDRVQRVDAGQAVDLAAAREARGRRARLRDRRRRPAGARGWPGPRSPRNGRARSRTSRPCRSSPSRAPSPQGRGTRRRAASVPAVPTSAFCWQWPWSRTRPSVGCKGSAGTRSGSATNASTRCAAGATEVGVGTEAEVAVLVDQGQQAARLAAEDRRCPLRAARRVLRRSGGGQLARRGERPFEITGRPQHTRPGQLDP